MPATRSTATRVSPTWSSWSSWSSWSNRHASGCGANFADLADLENKILAVIDEWNEIAHPFAGTSKSFEKVLNSVDDSRRRRPHWSDVIKAPAIKTAA